MRAVVLEALIGETMGSLSGGILRLSAEVDYALRALVEIAAAPPSCKLPARVIAERQRIPMAYLNNILGDLRRGGLVLAQRGVHGGWTLGLPPARITVADVLAAVRGRAPEQVGPRSDEDQTSTGAAIDALWTSLQASVEVIATRTTLLDLLVSSRSSGYDYSRDPSNMGK